MEYKRFGNKIIVRIDKDEEILEQVKKLALKENIRLAAVQALGATNSFTVGVYNVAEKQYYANSFSGSFEIVSLTGIRQFFVRLTALEKQGLSTWTFPAFVVA